MKFEALTAYMPSIEGLRTFCWGFLGATVAILMAHSYSKPMRIGSVNVTGLVNQFVTAESVKPSVTPEQMKKDVHQFSQKLDQAMESVSHKNHIVLVPSEAVLSGSSDYTEAVSLQVKSMGEKESGKQLDTFS